MAILAVIVGLVLSVAAATSVSLGLLKAFFSLATPGAKREVAEVRVPVSN